MAGRRVKALLAACAAPLLMVFSASLPAAAGTGQFTVVAPTAPVVATGSPGQYSDAACPSERLCVAVGAAHGEAVLTFSGDGGATWVTTAYAEAASLTALACPAASICYAGGEGPGIPFMLKTTDGGATWHPLPDPPSQLVISTLACTSVSRCVATGSGANGPGPLDITTDGGTTWSPASSPGFVNTVRCIGTRCWAAGGGAWRSDDGGASWTSVAPPEGTGVTWSDLIDIEFESPNDGYLVGGVQCGQATSSFRCPGALFQSSDGGSTWSLWQGSISQGFGLRIACAGGSCLYVTRTATTALVLQGRDGSWSLLQTLPGYDPAAACTPSGRLCILAGTTGSLAALYERGASAPAPSAAPASGGPGGAIVTTPGDSSSQSPVALAIATPAQLTSTPLTTLIDALLVLALVLFITFPAHLFNRTYEENHATIRAWWERHVPWLRRLRARDEAAMGAVTSGAIATGVVLLVGGVLGALLDPGFGANSRTAGLVLGFAAAIALGITLTGAAAVLYRRSQRISTRWHLHSLPSGLVVAAVCVVISRLVSFQPGYLYGVIGGVVFAHQVDARHQGREVAVTSLVTLALSIVAWFIWVPVTSAHPQHVGFGVAFLQDLLTALVVTGLVGLTIALVPLRFLPGERIASWHRGAWAAIYAVTLLALLELMLRPQSAHAHVDGAPFWTTLALFLAFGAASVAFWGYFRIRGAAPSEPAVSGRA